MPAAYEKYELSMGKGLKITFVIVAVQLLATCVMALIAAVFYTPLAMKSAVIGGVISVLTTLVFGLRTFAGGRFQAAEKMLVALYTAEALKILLTVILFVIAVKWLGVAFLPMILAYVVALMVFWLILPFRLA